MAILTTFDVLEQYNKLYHFIETYNIYEAGSKLALLDNLKGKLIDKIFQVEEIIGKDRDLNSPHSHGKYDK